MGGCLRARPLSQRPYVHVFTFFHESHLGLNGKCEELYGKDDACYMEDPTSYLGTVSVAATGQKCMHWRDAAANEELAATYAADTKNEKSGPKTDGNFCRAFAGDAKPWYIRSLLIDYPFV